MVKAIGCLTALAVAGVAAMLWYVREFSHDEYGHGRHEHDPCELDLW